MIPVILMCTVIPLACFLFSCQKIGLPKSILSHFWFFTIVWYVSFPIRAVLISFDLIDLQVERLWSWDEVAYSVVLSFIFWFFTYLGYLSMHEKGNSKISLPVNNDNAASAFRGQIIVSITIVMAIYFLYSTVLQGGEFRAFIGNEQNEMRVGKGGFFLLSELFILSSIAYLGRVMYIRRKTVLSGVETFLYIGVFFLSVLMSVAINSRRIMATLMLAAVVIYTVRGRRRWLLPALAIVATFLLSPVMQVIRYINVTGLINGDVSIIEAFSTLKNHRLFLTIFSSSFEGADHLAVFMEKAGWLQLFTGVDGGVSWLYNAVLALIPRTLWLNKPEIYGNVAQQYLLYPEMYASGAATTTLPPSFIVDFSFGFGVLFGFFLCVLLGRVLALMSTIIWDGTSNASAKAIALFVFINIFNIVRGGTGFI
ncbi:MAG: hypothetical protein AB1485_07705, partial [Candidatus Thermoplasmatota archaeon]